MSELSKGRCASQTSTVIRASDFGWQFRPFILLAGPSGTGAGMGREAVSGFSGPQFA